MMANRDRLEIGPHIVRYGIPADQKYLIGAFLETYDQIVINAAMVAHIRDALASFVMQRARNKPYFIDPQTHAFQHDISHLESSSGSSAGEIKRSIRRLLEAYGEPVQNIVGQKRRSIFPDDFRDPGLRKSFCKRVLDFQLGAIADEAETSETAKYYKFLKKKGIIGKTGFRPILVIAPYFCMDRSTFEAWLEVNLAFAKEAREIATQEGIPLGVQVVITQNTLCDAKQVDTLIRRYSELNPDAFMVWVDSFSEQESPESALNAFVQLVKGLGQVAPVVNLYGGFFSIMLVHLGVLAGVTHSLEYGEERPIVPVGGGIPVAKFYVPILHTRLAFRSAVRVVRALGGMKTAKDFYTKVCGCQQCLTVIKGDPSIDFMAYGKTKAIRGREFPLPETKDSSVRHYMWCKSKEYTETLKVKEVLKDLRDTVETLKREIGTENTEHCETWAAVLSKVVE